MIKKFNKTGLILLAASATLFTGCSDDFLKEKKNYGNMSEDIYNSYEGAKGRVNYLYNRLLPKTTDGNYFNDTFFITGNPDEFAKSTEEYSGFSKYVNPERAKITTSEGLDEYYHGEYKISAPWGGIRNCNDIIANITANEVLTEEQKEELLGQAYFFRAWAYWRLVRIYGGIPIIKEVQRPVTGAEDDTELFYDRSTTKECIDFMCSDLDSAAQWLPPYWENSADDYGRITQGAALALKSRIRLHYASPLYNRGDDRARWQLAYDAAKEAYDALSPYTQLTSIGVNASEWAKAFAVISPNPEAVFFTLHNNLAIDDYSLVNTWENNIRPGNLRGSGGREAPAYMVDLFPMADGRKTDVLQYTKLEDSEYPYDQTAFFANRDPRFYRTFAFPGVKWAAAGANLTDNHTSNPGRYPYASGDNYIFWGYAWYPDETELFRPNDRGKAFYADGIQDGGRKSVMVRKRSNDTDVSSALYTYTSTDAFKRSASPYLEIRFAEVLLNCAEAACGIGQMGEAVKYLQEVRERVGYTADNNYGLQSNLASDRAACFAAIMYERQIEFAYEGKRFDDMRRWLLWDGGVGHESISPSWRLTQWDGNTCSYLGVQPLNGKRRPVLEVAVKSSFAEADYEADPLKARRTADKDSMVLKLMTDTVIESEKDDDGKIIGERTSVDRLAEFYRKYFVRKDLDLETDNGIVDDPSIKFYPEYYILGLSSSVQKNNKTLVQTVGWEDLRTDAMGLFDPLAE